MRISFFFPAYHDEATIAPLVHELSRVLPRYARAWEVIVVDDASPDASGAIADRLAAADPDHVRVIHHPTNRGYSQALWSGIHAARYEWVGFTDGDMQYDVAELGRFARAARAGADIVVGRKIDRAEGRRRAVPSALYNAGLRLLFGLPMHDADCAFKLMHRSVFADFVPSVHYKEAFLLVEAFYRAHRRGAHIVEVPVSHRPRPHGESRCFTWRTTKRLALNSARGFVFGRVLGEFR